MVYPQTIEIGPIRDQVITGSTETPEGLTSYQTEPLYRGRVIPLRCPFCDLVIHIATDLAPNTLRSYLGYQAGLIAGLQMERVLTLGRAVVHSSHSHWTARDAASRFPAQTLRDAVSIAEVPRFNSSDPSRLKDNEYSYQTAEEVHP